MTFYLVEWVDEIDSRCFTRLLQTRNEAVQYIIDSNEAKSYGDTIHTIMHHLDVAQTYPAGLISGVKGYFKLSPITVTKKIDGEWK